MGRGDCEGRDTIIHVPWMPNFLYRNDSTGDIQKSDKREKTLGENFQYQNKN